MVNWYIRFLSDRKQRLVYNGTVCDWMTISKGTMQGSVSRPHLFNLLLDDDLETDSNFDDVSMVKYADSDSCILVTVNESLDNYRAVTRLQNKTRQVSSVEGASR